MFTVVSLTNLWKRTKLCVCESQQRVVQIVGQPHGVGSRDDRSERDGTRWSGNVEQASRKLHPKSDLPNVHIATGMRVVDVSQGSDSFEARGHAAGRNWKTMETESGGDVNIHDQRITSAQFEMFITDVREMVLL